MFDIQPTEVAVIAVVALLVVVLLVLLGLLLRRPAAPAAATSPADEPVRDQAGLPRAAIIVNPTKFSDVDDVHRQVTRICHTHGWGDPLWIETTKDDPGTGQARQAIDAGADLVCPLGGDGTVRSVATGLIDSGVPMGLLPAGTGNLLARNLGLPVDSLERALAVALNGRDDRIDVGTINVVTPGGTQDEESDYYFLVMAGLGFDASVMADAPEELKARFGWPAYVVSGMRHLRGARFDLDVTLDGGKAFHRKIRTIVVGNVGELQGGIELMPKASADDGALDVVLLSPRYVFGWLTVAMHILTRARWGHPRIEHHRCRTMSVQLEGSQEVQLDGDPIGPGSRLTFAVHPASLTVRVA